MNLLHVCRERLPEVNQTHGVVVLYSSRVTRRALVVKVFRVQFFTGVKENTGRDSIQYFESHFLMCRENVEGHVCCCCSVSILGSCRTHSAQDTNLRTWV